MTERVLTQRELNRAVLARQLLLDRRRLSIPRALERMGGIQNQYALNAYIRLWSCLDGFRRDELTRAYERRTVVHASLMRETIHVVSRDDYWPLIVATRRARQEWWLRINKSHTARDVAARAQRLREFLADGPRTRDEILRQLGERSFAGTHHWLDLVRVPPSGTWDHRRAHTFAAAEKWIGPPEVDVDDALDHLVRRYLAAFGPAVRDQIPKWSGIPATQLKPALARLELRRFRDADGKELVDVPRAPLPDAETPVPVRFLPTWDSLLLVHVRRAGIIDEEYRDRIFPIDLPPSFPTVLVDGRVVGTWKYENGRVLVDAFERIPRAAQRELKEEADRLAAFHA